MRRATAIAALAVVVTLTASPTAGASTLSGTCALGGRLDFDRSVGNAPHYVRFRDRAAGTCTGTLDGRWASNLPVTLRARGSGQVGCLASRTTSTGTLTFATGQTIRFWTDVHGALTELLATFGGRTSGEGVAHVDLLPYADQSVFAACQSNAVEFVRYDLRTQTVTPMAG